MPAKKVPKAKSAGKHAANNEHSDASAHSVGSEDGMVFILKDDRGACSFDMEDYNDQVLPGILYMWSMEHSSSKGVAGMVHPSVCFLGRALHTRNLSFV